MAFRAISDKTASGLMPLPTATTCWLTLTTLTPMPTLSMSLTSCSLAWTVPI